MSGVLAFFSPPYNDREIDHMCFAALDVVLVVVNVCIGYHTIKDIFPILNKTIKAVLAVLQVVFVLQAAASIGMVYLVFWFRGREQGQEFVAGYYGRMFEWLFLSVI